MLNPKGRPHSEEATKLAKRIMMLAKWAPKLDLDIIADIIDDAWKEEEDAKPKG